MFPIAVLTEGMNNPEDKYIYGKASNEAIVSGH
jgi:hypothetical protein